jgi:hypothetical protein
VRRRGALALAALLLSACGIPLDRAPHDVAPEQDVGVAGASAATDSASTSGPRIFFAAADPQSAVVRLAQVNRNVPPTPVDVLAELFKGLTDAERADKRLTTQIPLGTKLNAVNLLGDGTVVIDVDDGIFLNKSQAALVVAVAQIVYTVTALANVERVRLLVDGAARSWQAGDGRQRSGDYPSYYPANQPNLPPVPSPTTLAQPTTALALATTTSSTAAPGGRVTTVVTAAPAPPEDTTTTADDA